MTHAHIHQVYAKHEWVVRSEHVTYQPLYRYLSIGTLGGGGVRGGGVMKGDCRVSRGGGEYVQTCIKYAPLTMIGHRAVVYNIMLILFMYTYVV